jgi:hypothetical protein
MENSEECRGISGNFGESQRNSRIFDKVGGNSRNFGKVLRNLQGNLKEFQGTSGKVGEIRGKSGKFRKCGETGKVGEYLRKLEKS